VKGTPEERSRVVRPAGWLAPGPQPRGEQGDKTLLPSEEESCSFLTGNFRIFQRKVGHRWSADDFLTAYEALMEAERHGNVRSALDLGCGVGSVLMMVAWGLPSATLLGVEAQEISADLLGRSLRYNGLENRVRVKRGDMREPSVLAGEGPFDLITGTPPYFPVGAGVMSDKAQRGPCCFETRGGIESYCIAAASVLANNGTFVVCEGSFARSRVEGAANRAGLHIHREVAIIPKEGKPALFDIYVMRKSPPDGPIAERFAIRDASGVITPAMHAVRDRMGLPPTQHLEKQSHE
jgi:tRNA1Val (adenine37-N6)-methyltransferase